jgi:hypothetical protein
MRRRRIHVLAVCHMRRRRIHADLRMCARAPLLVMEFMSNGSLRTLLNNDTFPLDAELSLPLIRDILQVCVQKQKCKNKIKLRFSIDSSKKRE